MTIIAVAGFAVPANAAIGGTSTHPFDLDAVSTSHTSKGPGRIQQADHYGDVCIRYETDGGTLLGYTCPNQAGNPTALTQRRLDATNTDYSARWRVRLYKGESVDYAYTYMYFYRHKTIDDSIIDQWMATSPLLAVDSRSSAALNEPDSWAGNIFTDHCNVVGLRIYAYFIGNSTADYTFDHFYVHYERYGNP